MNKDIFKHLTVRNMRHPSNIFIRETPEGSLNGGESIFAGSFPVEEDCFVVEDMQVTARPLQYIHSYVSHDSAGGGESTRN